MKHLLVTLLLLEAACQPVSGPGDPADPVGSATPGPTVAASPDAPTVAVLARGPHADASPSSGQAFALSEVGSLHFDVTWPAALPQASWHEQTLDLYAPGGQLYQSMRVRFQPSEPPAATSAAVRAVLPVAGSAISEYALTGVWRVDVRLDGQQAPLASTSFMLQ